MEYFVTDKIANGLASDIRKKLKEKEDDICKEDFQFEDKLVPCYKKGSYADCQGFIEKQDENIKENLEIKNVSKEVQITLSVEEYVKLDKLRHLDEIKNELQNYLKKVGGGFLFLLTLIGALGLSSYVDAVAKKEISKNLEEINRGLKDEKKKIQKSITQSGIITQQLNASLEDARKVNKRAKNELSNFLLLMDDSSAKVKEELAVVNANINNLRQALKNQESVISDIPNIENKISELGKEAYESFTNNSDYLILVFYKSKSSKNIAKQIERTLTKKGYRSSITQTNLNELNFKHDKSGIWILYSPILGNKKNDIISTLEDDLALDSNYIKSMPNSLSKGDMQILIY